MKSIPVTVNVKMFILIFATLSLTLQKIVSLYFFTWLALRNFITEKMAIEFKQFGCVADNFSELIKVEK